MAAEPIIIKSINDLIELANMWSKENHHVLYRGHRVANWPLSPGIVRTIKTGAKLSQKQINEDTKQVERLMFDEFKRLCHPDITDLFISKDDNLELLSLAQHFDLPTRLLDWTSNPLAALYFAIRKIQVSNVTEDEMSCVWALCFKDKDSKYLNPRLEKNYKAVTKDIFNIDRTRIFKPKIVTPRIHVQAGWFTLHHMDEERGFLNLNEDKDFNGIHDLTPIQFPSKLANDFRDYLDILHINSSTLLPDIIGKVNHIKWKTLKHKELFDHLYDKNYC